MKLDNGNANRYLGIIVIGIVIMNLGFIINTFVKDISVDFLNGFKSGLCVVMQIVGAGIFAYGLISLIKHNQSK